MMINYKRGINTSFVVYICSSLCCYKDNNRYYLIVSISPFACPHFPLFIPYLTNIFEHKNQVNCYEKTNHEDVRFR